MTYGSGSLGESLSFVTKNTAIAANSIVALSFLSSMVFRTMLGLSDKIQNHLLYAQSEGKALEKNAIRIGRTSVCKFKQLTTRCK